MKRHPAQLLVAIAVVLGAAGCGSREPTSLREKLYKSYSEFHRAHTRGDLRLWQKYTSRFTFIDSKNAVVSSGGKFDGAYLKRISGMIPPLEGMEKLAVRQKGNTAKLILFGRPANAKDSLNMRVVPSYHIVDFIREDEMWKVHLVHGQMPSRLPGAEEAVSTGDHSSILTNDVFIPSGTVPAAPQEVLSIQLQGMLNVTTGGYSTHVWINGYNQCPREPIIDASNVRPVIGGLVLGTNVINLVVEEIQRPSCYGDHIPEYKVVVVRVNDHKETDLVFAYTPINIPGSHERTFVIDKKDF